MYISEILYVWCKIKILIMRTIFLNEAASGSSAIFKYQILIVVTIAMHRPHYFIYMEIVSSCAEVHAQIMKKISTVIGVFLLKRSHSPFE